MKLGQGARRARVSTASVSRVLNNTQFCHPALTTVHIPRDQIGRTICECLMNRGNAPLEREFGIDPELVLRDSTGPAAG